MAVPLLVASLAMQGYAMSAANKAAKQSAADAKATAAYNSRVDLAEAKQIEYDSEENTRSARREARVYLSRQEAAYVTAGVLNSGSALAVQAETAGRLEQGVLQERLNASREIGKRESAAKMGILYGDMTSKGILAQNRVNMLNGGANMLMTAGQIAMAGGFGGGKGPGAGGTTGGGLRSSSVIGGG